MSQRWDGLTNDGRYVQADTGAVLFGPQPSSPAGRGTFVLNAGAPQTGQFVRSELDGVSGFVKCFYYQSETTTCERDPGCCLTGCCPKDWLMLTGMWILIAFVAAAIVGAIVIAVICFVLSKSKERKERAADVQSQYAYSNYAGSQVGYAPPPPQFAPSYTAYGGYMGPPSTKY